MSLLITCDLGGWRTPPRLRSHLEDTELASSSSMIAGHINSGHVETPGQVENSDRIERRRVDREANLVARRLAHRSGGLALCNEYRGDLVDVGRSLHHRDLFSPAVRGLPASTREAILEEIYTPYRNRVERQILELLQSWSYVVHLSVRTFDAKTSAGKWRRADVGLLYDPARGDEVDWCLDLIDELYAVAPELRVRRNYPGRGTNDSLTKTMRSQFSETVYLGIEMVLNRAWVARPVLRRDHLLDQIGDAIGALTAEPVVCAA